ncbi:MAG: protein-glutamate O-methyltransferase CheR [Ekhidna sp.]|nr:protein-glutamate O-methyltransferase CheR [Ekhidna sp.]MBC6424883.1 protein-glutamate O-methyltransferase CheR [Ekhidna sp.]
MVFLSTDVISDEELTALMQAINNRYGLDFTNYERTSLKRGIIRLMMEHKMKTIIELWSVILKDKDFFKNAIDNLLVNLTELFRNPDVWIKLRDNVLRRLGRENLHIWHAGCSTGEEVYTMAFVLEAIGMLHSARLTATDLSTTALNKAVKGEYSLLLLKQYLVPFLKFFPNTGMEYYFDFQDTCATIKPKYRANVTFRKHNLVTDPMIDQFDLIFCRNVMIYFDEVLKYRVLKLLHKCLKPDGYLVIGYYDIMPDVGKEYFDIYDVKTRIYKRKN